MAAGIHTPHKTRSAYSLLSLVFKRPLQGTRQIYLSRTWGPSIAYATYSATMTINSVLRSSINNCLATVVLVTALVLVFAGGNNVVEADEFPPFYLQAAKSMPRLGRSESVKDLWQQAMKSIPRMGRRGYASTPSKAGESGPWFPKRPVDLSGPGGNQWSSENYLRAIEQSPELWEMTSADVAANSPISAGLNNEVWQREKRTGSGQAEV